MFPEQLLTSMEFLALVFFLVALIYSAVGLGGGSSYTALMAIYGANILVIPMVSLTLNLVVTTAGSFNFIRNGHARIGIILPFLISSMPMAYIGGAIKVSPTGFYLILMVSLMFVAARIYFWNETRLRLTLGDRSRLLVSLAAGAVLGLVGGIVGIGGGVFLVPLIILLGLGDSKQAAASGAIFIWLNSLTGLVSRLQYNSIDLMGYIPLIMAVLAGGALGSFMGAYKLSARFMEKLLGVVILVAIVFIFRKLLAEWGGLPA